jgi:hypothetical protein
MRTAGHNMEPGFRRLTSILIINEPGVNKTMVVSYGQ